MSEHDTALARQTTSLTPGQQSPLPTFSGAQMENAFAAYKDLQVALDKAMPDAIMELDGRKFRKKNYWRGVAVAFNLTIETVSERREVSGHFHDGRENFGYVVTKRATAPNGRTVTADGACFAVEKARRFKCPHPHPSWAGKSMHFPHVTCPDFDPEFQWRVLPGDATEHNVRGHASTRAFNRAVSDLVGFGEVSAEEVEHDDHTVGQAAQQAKPAGRGQSAGAAPIASPQASQPAGEATGPVLVTGITSKTGKTQNNKPWTRYEVAFSDGRKGVTFSDTLAGEVQKALDAKLPVNPDLQQTEKGTDLKGLLPVVHPEPVHPDEPVNGPEKVLTVRKMDTDKGPRWEIQTDKRRLLTDVEHHATDAVAARHAKRGIVPTFDVLKTATGTPVNKLTSFTVPDDDSLLDVTDREPGGDDE
jgi:hypothetical protein